MRNLTNVFLIFFFLPGVLFFVKCTQTGDGRNNKSDKIYIVATTGMIADAARNIAGSKAQVEALMGPGVDPHLYKATRSDLSKLRKADLVLYNGLHLEGKMGEVLLKLGKGKPVIAVADRIDPNRIIQLAASENVNDPHVWFDVSLWIEVVKVIAEEIGKNDPSNKELYSQNAAKFISELETLHREVKQKIQSIPERQRVLITAHDAFEYFGKAYQMEVRALQGISTLSEFGLKDVSNLVNFIVERKIKAVFVESSIPKKSLESVVEGCKNKGQEVRIGGTLYSDAMGAAGTPEGTYVGMINANVKTIVDSLK